MRRAKRSWCVGLGAGLFLATAPAPADVPTRLVYVRTPEAAACPDQAALQKAVEARLGHDPFSIWGENTILATVSAGGGALRARAELVDGQGVLRGSRDVVGRASDCNELILALALAISITLDPMQLPAPSEEQLAPTPPVETETEPQPAPERPRASLVPSRPPVAEVAVPPRLELPTVWSAYASLFANAGVLPGPSGGARVGVAFRRGWGRAGIELGYVAPVPEDEANGGRVVISQLAGNLYGCTGISLGIHWCVLGSLGALRGRGEGVTSPRTEMLLDSAAGTRLLFERALGAHWTFTAHADVLARLSRPTFTLKGEFAWRPPPVFSELGLSLLLPFS